VTERGSAGSRKWIPAWLFWLAVIGPAAAQISFRDVGDSTNSVVRVNLHGSGFFDYNGDGWDDIFVVHNSSVGAWRSFPHALLRNERNGRFLNVTDQAGCPGLLTQSAQGFAAADYDNDGFTDLLIACGNNGDKALLYHNDGDGTYTSAPSGLTDGAWTYRARNASFIDIDNDGLLDLFFTACAREPEFSPELPVCVVYQNDGWSPFLRRDAGLGSILATGGDLYGMAVADIDLDGDQDVFVPRRDAQSLMLVNNGNGVFSDQFIARGLPYPASGETYYVGAAFLDYDNDGDWDLFVRRAYKPALLFRNDGGFFTEVGASAGVAVTVPYTANACFGGGLSTGDFDNDGNVDLFIITRWAMECLLFRNNGNGTFSEMAASAGLREDCYDYWSAPVGDYDRDGFLDVYMARSNSSDPRGGGHLYRNTGGAASSNRWIEMALTGVVSNRSAVGSRVTLYAGGRKQVRQVLGGSGYMTSSLRVHFGIGRASVIDSVVIRWPAGTVQRLIGVAPNHFISVSEAGNVIRYDVLSVEGTVRHSPTGYPIPRAAVRTSGGATASASTDAAGAYRIHPLLAGSGDLTLAPDKTAAEDVGDNAVTAYDASMVLRALSGNDTLGAGRRDLADADRDGSVTALDAAFIARYAVGRRNDGISRAGGWLFSPARRSVTLESESVTGQDFTCQVIGDASRNWGVPLSPGKTGPAAAVAPPSIAAPAGGGEVEIPLTVEAGSGLLAADVWFRVEGSGLIPEGVETTDLTAAFDTEWNGSGDGLWKVALYGAEPVLEAGAFCRLKFRLEAGATGVVSWERLALNERETRIPETVVGFSERPGAPADRFGLGCNYPNPFNPSTAVTYRLDRPGDAGLVVFDVRGRRVRELVRGRREAGEYRAVWDGRDESGLEAAAGVYIARLESGGRVRTIKLIKLP
jgi:enediyne biosynthesis protein E4